MIDPSDFEWDPLKEASNRAKHGVAFADAMQVWSDPRHLLRFDRIENGEERWHLLRLAGAALLLLVVHTYPGEGGSVVRIVGARRATRNERQAYVSGDHG